MKVILSEEYVKKGAALAVPGAYWERGEGWVVDDPTPKAASIAIALFPAVLMDYPELGDMRDQLYGDARPDDFATKYGVKLAWGLQGIMPFDYQALDTGYIAAQLKQIGGGFLGWDRGLGKTAASLAIAAELPAKRILVVCGNTMKQAVWGDEIANLWPEAQVSVIPNEKRKREEWLAYHSGAMMTRPGTNPLVCVVHYEALALIAGDKGRGKGWDKLGVWDLMIFDEAHRLANTKTQMHRAAMKARKRSKHALALTGTAIMNRADDLFGQLNWVFPKTYKAKWKDWNDRYLEYVRTDYGMVCVGFKVEMLEKLRRELGVFMVYRTKNSVLDLPKRTEETRMIDLSKKQRKAYDELRDQFWTQLDSGEELSASNPLAQLNMLRRVATGLSATESRVDDSTKLDFCMELIEDNEDEAFVVFSWYKAPLYTLSQRLDKKGIGHHIITGDTKQVDRPQAVEDFQAGKGRVFLGTLSTLGESVNLQRASSAVFLDRAWNPAVNAQAADRIYRIGQDRPVTITHLVARDTVDELRVQPVLASKDALRKAVLGAE